MFFSVRKALFSSVNERESRRARAHEGMPSGTRGSSAPNALEQTRAFDELLINCETRDARLLEGETFFPESTSAASSGGVRSAKAGAQPASDPAQTSDRAKRA